MAALEFARAVQMLRLGWLGSCSHPPGHAPGRTPEQLKADFCVERAFPPGFPRPGFQHRAQSLAAPGPAHATGPGLRLAAGGRDGADVAGIRRAAALAHGARGQRLAACHGLQRRAAAVRWPVQPRPYRGSAGRLAGALDPGAGVPGRGRTAQPCPFADAHQPRSEEHTSELQSPCNLVCRLLLEKKKQCMMLLAPNISLDANRSSSSDATPLPSRSLPSRSHLYFVSFSIDATFAT